MLKYSKRDDKKKRKKAYSEIGNELETFTEEIKVKIIGLRAQLNREINQENKNKTDQGSENGHLSSWSFRSQLQLIRPAMTAAKCHDNISWFTSLWKSHFGMGVLL